MKKRIHWVSLIVCILIPLVIGFVSGIATAQGVDGWFTTLNKPSFNPPNWLFAPVWTALYIAMGVALYLIYHSSPDKYRNRSLLLFGIQLFFNFLWSFLFFYYHYLEFSFYWIITLWLILLVLIYNVFEKSRWATMLLIPYLLWVGFASVLNFSIWQLNN